MVPHYLSLTNFLSYRDTTKLELRDVHLACISGLNGAGKSSLLDAITWALFGRGRSTDDNVVNRTAAARGEAAEVTFIFSLEGAVYRVIRRKAVGKTTQLELHVQGGTDDGEPMWRTMTLTGVRETQRSLEDLLRMQYDVFTNASFLLQGQADEFTTKTPNRRKEILAEILGVNRWDTYKALATDRRKAVEGEEKLIDRRLEDIDAELSQEAERRQELERAEGQEQRIGDQLATQDALVTTLREKRALIEQQRAQLARTASELTQTQAELQRLDRDIATRRTELESNRALIDRAPAIEAAHAAYQALAAELAAWQERADAANDLLRERQPHEIAVSRARAALETRLQNLMRDEAAAAEALASRQKVAADLAGGRKRLERLEAELATLTEREAAWHAARDRLQQAGNDIRLWQQERDQLASQAEQAERDRADQEMIAASHEQAKKRLEAAETTLAALAEHEGRRTSLAVDRTRLQAELDAMRREGGERKERIEQLRQETGGDCPICGQPLTEAHRADVLRELEAAQEAERQRYRATEAQLRTLEQHEATLGDDLKRRPQLERERDSQVRSVSNYAAQLERIATQLQLWEEGRARARLAELEAQLANGVDIAALRAEEEQLRQASSDLRSKTREQQLLMADLGRLETQCQQHDQTAEKWAQQGRPALLSTRRDLDEQRYATEAQAKLAAIEKRLAAVGYDAPAHQAVRERLAQQRDVPAEYEALRRAEAAVKPLQNALAELEHQRAREAARVVDLEERQAGLEAALREMQAGVTDLRAAEAELARLRDDQAAAIRATSAARQRVEVLADLRRTQKKLRAERQTVAVRIGQLRQLEEACGRNGVQALLIESALPEIEDHANELLNRLSGGEMSVRFDTQRSRKSDGGQIETLDIHISDNNSERPYENYSGGEKFRVNFAIRLALSQVLARRSGARLQTLVIDEGFGSQDPEGRQRLVEAINAVQPEFACILVITHIDELRDKFPARIEVEKTPSGSRLELVAV